MKEKKDELKGLVRQGEIEKALFELRKILDENSNLYDKLIMLDKRYNDIKKEHNILGIISSEDARIENNRIANGLTELINKIGKPCENNAKIGKRQIAINDAIEWLTNALINQYREKLKEEIDYESGNQFSIYEKWNIDDLTIDNNGEFLIKESYQLKIVKEIQVGPDDFVFSDNPIKSIIKNITGSFVHINNIKIQDVEGEKSVKSIRFLATYYKKHFHIKSTKIFNEQSNSNKKGVKQEENDEYENEFILYIDNIERAERIQKAMDDLAIHFGRKEDPF